MTPQGHAPPDIRLAHGVRDRQIAADDADDHEQRVHRHREGEEQNTGDAQNQADYQHAERGQQENLTEEPGDE